MRSIKKKCSKVLLYECFSSLASTVELESKIHFQPLIKILNKMTKVAINGFGRIGRLAFRQM
ncbi:hypothetical protein, partial [Prevotella sp.]